MAVLAKRGLHAQVVNALGARIMRGQLPPGASLDTESVMSEFAVSRTVVREAFRVLMAKGLVEARPKLGTYVTSRENWQLLDVDVMVWRTSGTPDPRLVLELDQVRTIFEPEGAALAAAARTDAELVAIGDAYRRLEASYRGADSADHVEADVAFHLAILAASGNELLTRFQVILEPALQARHRLASEHLSDHDFLAGHRAVFDAIADSAPETARKRMSALMRRSARDIEQILERGEG